MRQPNNIKFTFTDADCIQLYDTIHNFIYSIGCHLVTHDAYKHVIM